ncbi:hypothetical protein NQ315_000360 [Exocentrus adspersus]|uniref:Regulator of microtubule dynamics protein 1 n=1 Tax=Exocentrus adspersus TaxID=1586481 RepID=A0AAV8VLF8_9CUCU|nr:hypothetical protein NQ315_000360 [Exocentrus adspersus]
MARLWCAAAQNKKHYLYIFTFIKSISQYLPFANPQPGGGGGGAVEEKALRYWSRTTLPDTISIADKLFEEEKYLEVYELLNRIRFNEEVEVLWRIARTLYNLSFEKEVTTEERWQMVEEAYQILRMALETGKNASQESADVHKWMAIVLDAKHGLVNLQTRIKHAATVKHHLTRATELNPHDFTAQYMLGKFCYEMSRLSWFQRMLARYFVAWEPPQCTYQEAFKYLSKAEELQPRTFLPNIYLLGRTCIEIGQFYKARYYLNVAVNLPPKDECEKCCVQNARYLIKKLDRYDLGRSVLFYDFPFGFSD